MAKTEIYVKIVRDKNFIYILADDMMKKLSKNLVWKPVPLPTGFKVSPLKVRSMAANDDMRDVYFMTKEEYNRWCHDMTYIPIISWNDLGEPSPFRTENGEPIEFHSGWVTCKTGNEIKKETWDVLNRQGYLYHITQQGNKVDLANKPDLWVLPKLYRDTDQKIPLSKELKAQIRNLAKTKPELCRSVADEFWRVLDGTEDWIYKSSETKIGDVVETSITGEGYKATISLTGTGSCGNTINISATGSCGNVINVSGTGSYTNYGGFVKITPEDLEENYIKEDEKVKEDIKQAINSVYGAGAMYGTPTKNGRAYVQRPENRLKVIEKVIFNGDTTIVFFKVGYYPYPVKIVISRQEAVLDEPRLSLEDRVLLACVKRHRCNKQWKYICDTVDLRTTTINYIAKNNVPTAYLADYKHDINYIFNRLPKKNKVLIIQKEPEV